MSVAVLLMASTGCDAPDELGRDELMDEEPSDAQERSAGGLPVAFAHYYPWWDGSCADKSLQPTAGWYSNQWGAGATAVVASELQTAASYGISGFIYEWTGAPNAGTGAAFAEDDVLDSTFIPAVEQTTSQFYLTFDSDIWHINNWGPTASGLVDMWSAQKDRFIDDIGYVCENYGTHPQYHEIDGRPVIFLYAFNRWHGPQIAAAISGARQACVNEIGVEPYFIGDFQISPRAWNAEYWPRNYAGKAQMVDAIGNYSLYGGYGIASEADSLKKFAEDGRLWQALLNGQALANGAGKPFFPGIQPQYFKVDRSAGACGSPSPIWNDDSIGYMPAARWGDPGGAQAASEAALDLLINNVRGFGSYGEVTITTWNEPVEGTGVFPTSGPNGEGFTMGTYFLDVFEKYLDGTCGGWCTH